jgi:hypothetical protein
VAAATASAHPARLAPVVGEALLASPWLARLGRISFLGTLDLHPRSKQRWTRLDHSLAVAGLGLAVGEALALPPDALRLLVTACLLHDIGHYPLSHAAEPGFQRALGVAHHGVSEWIVRGCGEIPVDQSLRPLLEAAGLDPELVWAVIVGEAPPPHGVLSALLLAPINLDTLDGIRRTARAFRRHGLALPPTMFRRDGDELLIDPAAVPVFDQFWRLKDRMYAEVINLPSNIVCEAALSRAVAAAYDRGVFARFAAFDDAALGPLAAATARSAGLLTGDDERFQFLRAPVSDADLPRARKRYHIDPRVEPGAAGLRRADWSRRWRHGRQLLFVSEHAAPTQLLLPGLQDDAAMEPIPPGAEGPEI